MLKQIGEALAGMQTLTVTECERAFNCVLCLNEKRLRTKYRSDYWGTCPDMSIKLLDVRFWRKGGIVVAKIDERVQESLVEQRKTLGKPDGYDAPLVSFSSPTPAPDWTQPMIYSYIIDGAKISVHVDEMMSDGSKRLVSVSRKFYRTDR
jgi:hypothetical protein